MAEKWQWRQQQELQQQQQQLPVQPQHPEQQRSDPAAAESTAVSTAVSAASELVHQLKAKLQAERVARRAAEEAAEAARAEAARAMSAAAQPQEASAAGGAGEVAEAAAHTTAASPTEASPQPLVASSQLRCRSGHTMAFFDDMAGSFGRAAKLIASVVAGVELSSMGEGGEEGLASAVRDTANRQLIGHGSTGKMGPSVRDNNKNVTAERILKAVVNGAPSVSELVVVGCNAGALAESLANQWSMRRSDEKLSRRMGIVGVGSGDYVKLDLADLESEMLQRRTNPHEDDLADAYSEEQLVLMERVSVAAREGEVKGGGGVSAAAVALAVLMRDLAHHGTVQDPAHTLAQLTVPVAEKGSADKGFKIKTKAAAGVFRGDPFSPWQLQGKALAVSDAQNLNDLFEYFQLVFESQIALPEYQPLPPPTHAGKRASKPPAEFVPGSNDNPIVNPHR